MKSACCATMICGAAALLLASCAGISGTLADSGSFVSLVGYNGAGGDSQFGGSGSGQSGRGTDSGILQQALTAKESRLVAAARSLVGARAFNFGDRHFLWDCAGTILAIYYRAGYDLTPYFNRVPGNGVTRLYEIAQDHKLIYRTTEPEPGDIIFWDNTYDRNLNRKWDDLLTHAGMVVDTRKDGTIEYIHLNYARGVVIERMNLRHPSVYEESTPLGTVLLNSPMRMRKDVYLNPGVLLAGQLFRNFGALPRLPG